jgi:hypothetical protein
VAADAEAGRQQGAGVGALVQVIQHRDAVRVELSGRGAGRARQPGLLAGVVELQGDAGQLATRVDLRYADDEAGRGQAPGRAQGRLGQLEDVGVEQHPGPPAVADRPDHHRADPIPGGRHPHLVLNQLHARDSTGARGRRTTPR